jgi:hypothetical protein
MQNVGLYAGVPDSAAEETPSVAAPPIYAALLAVQGELSSVARDSVNPHFNKSYASLGAVLDVVRPVLQKNGLVLIQAPAVGDTSELRLETFVIHAVSGTKFTFEAKIPLGKQDPQGWASALTYARRYVLLSIFGLKTADDDAESAVVPTGPQNAQRNPKPPGHDPFGL